jgi:osmotically-inducible protein OsmY
VRSSLGRDGLLGDLGRINLSSCGSVVTLHGSVRREEERLRIEALVRRIEGVKGVENKLKVRGVVVRE